MSALNKAILAKSLQKLDISRVDAKNLVDDFFNEIKLSLAAGREVKLSGFGNFKLRNKQPRPGRNPISGQEVLISARRVVTFKVGSKLKNKFNNQEK